MATTGTPDPSLTRRAVLLVGASAALVACGAEVTGTTPADAGNDADPQDATRTDATASDASDASATDAAQPDASVPDAMTADRAQPDATQPDATQPDVTQPDAALEVTRPDATLDAAADVTRPDAARDAAADVSCTPPASATRIGPLSSFAVNRWVAVTSISIIVGRDARGIFAYSGVCPHRSCGVPAPASATTTSRCPCHGAIFNSDGRVLSGPTATSLVNYPVFVCNNNVWVDKTRTVAMGTRTAVP